MKKLYVILLMSFTVILSAGEGKAQCTANFSFSTSGNTATFTDLSTAGFGSVISWGWNFGDGAFSGTQNPVHTYAACGVYNVSLTIATSAFCTNTYTAAVTVNGGITPSFTYNVDTTNGNVTFQASPLGINLNYVWSFGDGTYDSAAFSNHTYPAGVYTVCLTVADNAGICSATVCDTITVNVTPPPCTTTFTWNDNGGGTINFQVSPFNFGTTYTWDYGDGSSGTGGFTIHTFPVYGTYVVCLTAVDSATMCTSNFCDTLVLAQDPTNCNVTFSSFNNNGQVGFFANSTSTNNSYSWNFGDGNTSTGAATSNTYMSSGTYYVCLSTANTFDACTATSCDSVVVVISGIGEEEQSLFNLSVYPNPMSSGATVNYFLNRSSEVEMYISDVLGKTIQLIDTGNRNQGKHEAELNTQNIDSGIYLLKMKVDEQIETRKIIISN
jgi:PKD repeat protein